MTTEAAHQSSPLSVRPVGSARECLAIARARLLPRVEEALQKALSPRDVAPALYGMLRYHLGWANEQLQPASAPTGKRLRPMLCVLVAEACGAPLDHCLPAATALELLHNFTLIHDDIEDGDSMRHHRPTVWKVWGEPQAINAGDAMHVFSTLAVLDLIRVGVPAERVVTLASLMSETCLRITEGQYLDLAFEHREDVTPDEYLDMIGRKSAALLSCAAEMGARIADAPEPVCRSAAAFGYALGMGFQVRDDVLGIWGRSDTTGKPAGDLRRRKKTLPTLYALSHAGIDDRRSFQRLFSEAMPADVQIDAVLSALAASGAREHCEEMVIAYSRDARQHLSALPPGDAVDALGALVEELETREF